MLIIPITQHIMKLSLIFVVALFATQVFSARNSLLAASHQVVKCPSTCRLALCSDPLRNPIVRDNGESNLLRGNKRPMGGAFCTTGGQLLRQVKIGEASVTPQKSGIPYKLISEYNPPQLTVPFEKSYFTVWKGVVGQQRVSRKRGSGNQFEVLDKHCVTIPVLSYKAVLPTGRVGPRVTTTSPNDCITMRVLSTKLEFELSWNTTDDFDLKVTEPDGTKIDFRNKGPMASGGRLNSDNRIGECSLAPVKDEFTREAVIYLRDSNPQIGRYVMTASRYRDCARSEPTEYCLRAIVNGRVIKTKCGVTDRSFSIRKVNFKLR